jgi:hypothetical protein
MDVMASEKAQFSSFEELGSLGKEAGERGEFLERLEIARVKGRISNATYEQLKKERLDRLEEIRARVGEFENAKRRLAGRDVASLSSTMGG